MTNRPSSTALLIARALVLLAADPAHAALVAPGAAEASFALLKAGGISIERFRRLAGHPWFRALLYAAEHRTLPGILTHYARRKWFLEEVVRESLTAGVGQVVVLGAGLDTLALRLCVEHPQVLFWELDQAATQEVKRRGLAGAGLGGPNLTLLPLDLNTTLPGAVLRADSRYRPEAATLFIAEGLLMYLAPGRVADLLSDLRGCGGPGSRLGFTFLEMGPGGRPDFHPPSRLIRWWLEVRGEPFQWGLNQAALGAFLQAHGWTLSALATPNDLQSRYPSASPKLLSVSGDLVAVADFA